MPAIEVRALTKRFRVPVRGSGLAAALGSLVRRSYDVVEAVRDLSFAADEGEMIGLLVPNGAGKTTTLKSPCRTSVSDRRRGVRCWGTRHGSGAGSTCGRSRWCWATRAN